MRKLVENYINSMTLNDVVMFASKNNITLTNDEVNYIYKEIKKNWEHLIYGDPTFVFDNLKNNISSDNYDKAVELFKYYRDKYKYYL